MAMANLRGANKILIAGSGIAGLGTALALHRMGVKGISVLEQANALRVTGASLTIWDNGWRALEALGVADTLRRSHTRLQSIETMLTSTGMRKAIDLKGHEVRCVRRRELLEALAAALPAGTIQFGSKISTIRETGTNSADSLSVELENGRRISPKVLIGCDGVNSVVSKWLGLGTPNLAGRSTLLALSSFPQGHPFPPKTLQTWGKGRRSGFAPCDRNHVFWFSSRNTCPRDAEIAYDAKALLEEALREAEDLGAKEMAEIIERTQLPTLSLAVLRYRFLWPFSAERARRGNVTVAGDAMHPMTPDLGQGGAMALEDSVILGRCLAESGLEESERIHVALEKYVEARKWRAFGMGVGSYVSGVLQFGKGSLPRLIRDKVLFNKLSPKTLRHTEFDCGNLSI